MPLSKNAENNPDDIEDIFAQSSINSSLKSKHMPRSNKGYDSFPWLAVVLTAVIVLILVIGGYFAYQYIKLLPTESPAEETTNPVVKPEDYQVPLGITMDNPQEQTPANTDPTADSQAYKVPLLHSTKATNTSSTLFSFKYPVGLVVKQNETQNYLVLNSEPPTSTQLVVNWNKTAKNLPDYLREIDAINATAWEGKSAVRVTTSTNGQLGTTAVIIREQKLLAADLNEYVAYFKASDTVYSVGLIAPELNQSLAGFFIAFLSNFRLGQ
jgi:hypothetical protein